MRPRVVGQRGAVLAFVVDEGSQFGILVHFRQQTEESSRCTQGRVCSWIAPERYAVVPLSQSRPRSSGQAEVEFGRQLALALVERSVGKFVYVSLGQADFSAALSERLAVQSGQPLFAFFVHLVRRRRFLLRNLFRPRVVLGNADSPGGVNERQQRNSSFYPIPFQEVHMVFAQSSHAQPHVGQPLQDVHSLFGILTNAIGQPQLNTAVENKVDPVSGAVGFVRTVDFRHSRVRARILLASVVRNRRPAQRANAAVYV